MTTKQTTLDNRSKWGGISSFIAFTIMPLLSSSALTFYLFQNQGWLETFSRIDWLIASLVLVVVCAIAIIPPTFLAVVMGYFIGWTAIPYLILINLGAISLIYGLYKFLKFSWFEKLFRENKKINNLLNGIRKNELKMIFYTKLSPLFPFAVTNLIFAVSGSSFRNILLGGFLGMIPRTVLAVFVGLEAIELRKVIENPNQDSISKVVIGALIIVSALGMFSVIKKAVRQ